jgi:hypothetical protein
MRIEGPRQPEKISGRSPVKGAAGRFTVDTASESRGASASSATIQVSALDALLALQEVAEPLTGKRKAVRRANDMLDLLDDIKLGLLSGQVTRQTLHRLTDLVAERREDFIEPGLQGVIDEIDLRAQVELAKLEYAS